MRLNIALGIIVVLASLLQGCGHKGPLTHPAPQAQPSGPQIPSLQTSGSEPSTTPTPQQSNLP